VEIRDLRDLTRYRRQLVNTHSAEVNRLHKVLEEANIKLASVATDVMGVSGRAILRALLAGAEIWCRYGVVSLGQASLLLGQGQPRQQ
jgi:hypothetical protein